jgi:hypothetical protein
MKDKIIMLVIALLVVIAIFWAILTVTPNCVYTTAQQSVVEMHAIRIACAAYRDKYGAFPTGDNATIMRTLTGENLKSIVFLEISKDSTATNGAFLDPWGRPYRIDLTGKEPLVTCAGPDARFGTEDDSKEK